MRESEMKAVWITRPGEAGVLRLAPAPRPAPGPRDVLVRVRAAGVNRADVLQRLGRYPAPAGVPPDVPGLEYAGTIEELGAPHLPWQLGERVMGIVAGGAYAEYLVVDARHPMPMPDAWSFEQGAAAPEAFLTAYDALVQADGYAAGRRVLVHAVGSGVGTALLQLAKAVGATAAGTSRTPAKLERALALGLDRPLLVTGTFQPADDLRDWADVTGDLVGAPYLAGTLAAAAPRGRIVVIGLTGGHIAEVDLGLVLRKRLTLIGTALRGRSADEKAALVRAFREAVGPLFEAGRVRPVVDQVFSMHAAADAHRHMEANRNFGSIVLAWP